MSLKLSIADSKRKYFLKNIWQINRHLSNTSWSQHKHKIHVNILFRRGMKYFHISGDRKVDDNKTWKEKKYKVRTCETQHIWNNSQSVLKYQHKLLIIKIIIINKISLCACLCVSLYREVICCGKKRRKEKVQFQ